MNFLEVNYSIEAAVGLGLNMFSCKKVASRKVQS